MTERNLDDFFTRAAASLDSAGRAACNEAACEPALIHLTKALFDLLGDRQAHTRPGALKAGERQFFVAGIFLLTPDRKEHLLVAEHGFPDEQHRLRFDADTAHPGWVYRNEKSLILANTDQDPNFKQILKTARMGSALYAPMFWDGRFIGQFVMAAQARNTFSAPDLPVICGFAPLAAAVYQAKDGPALLRSLA